MYYFVTMTAGPEVGANYPLDPARENRIGRGVECDVVLTDPLSSRVHAIVVFENDAWWMRDSGSRNGSYVNGQKIDEAQLADGCTLRVGTTEFCFHSSDQPPSQAFLENLHITQTIIKESPIGRTTTDAISPKALSRSEQAQDLLLLHQLAIKLLSLSEPDEVVRVALDLLYDRANASVVGFLWVNDEGRLKPKLVMPENAADEVSLSESLTEVVCQDRKAVWIDNKSLSESADSLSHFADAICAPLVHEVQVVGAIHLYLLHGRFSESEFDFTMSLANILVVALVRARRQAILETSHQRLVDKSAGSDELVGESAPMKELDSKITRIARASGCVLVRGESGSGKELVSAAIHKTSARADRPMLSVNCAAIPRDLMESQLFGHKKGAFTGADSDHDGWFRQADTGTLFLDEVGELTLEGQAKLLRILEGHPFLPVGDSKEITVDVRVIAATNRDLREFVREKRFREDLYYRLSVFELCIPPLRERGGDVELLLNHFLEHFKRQHGRPGLGLSESARKKLLGYNWPGNVRQLRNVIDSAVVMAEGAEIVPEDLGLRDTGGGELETLRIDHWERKLIKEALSRTGSNVPDAAKLMGIGRATLYRKIEEYGISR